MVNASYQLVTADSILMLYSSTDEYQSAMVSVLKTLVQGEINLFKEFEHLKKAIDLVTLEMFKIKNRN